jgi:peptidoglycan/LPS O-acetylase OafA/YrhL
MHWQGLGTANAPLCTPQYLLLGCLAAIVRERVPPGAHLWSLAAVVFGAALFGFLRGGHSFLTTLGFVISYALVVLALWRRPATHLGRALAVRPLVALGTRSYGFYVLHWFAVVPCEHMGIRIWIRVPVCFAATVLAAGVSYAAIERPFGRLAQRLRQRWRSEAPMSASAVG